MSLGDWPNGPALPNGAASMASREKTSGEAEPVGAGATAEDGTTGNTATPPAFPITAGLPSGGRDDRSRNFAWATAARMATRNPRNNTPGPARTGQAAPLFTPHLLPALGWGCIPRAFQGLRQALAGRAQYGTAFRKRGMHGTPKADSSPIQLWTTPDVGPLAPPRCLQASWSAWRCSRPSVPKAHAVTFRRGRVQWRKLDGNNLVRQPGSKHAGAACNNCTFPRPSSHGATKTSTVAESTPCTLR